MNFVDIAILVCCVPALIHGISKGFIKQAIALLSLVLGAWLAFKFSEPVGDLLQNYIEIPGTVIHIIAFALIMVLVTVVLKLLGNILEKTVKFVMLGWLDKLLGVVFAFIKVTLIIGLLAIMIDSVRETFQIENWKVFDESLLYQPLKDIADTVFPYLKQLIFKN
ncbi:MAG: CvpA family protein [Bacteroidales bacterium]|nr:CvpA family protein [Bacteroidales bacterium]